MAICRKCGELNKDGLKYCVYCGGELELTEASGLKRKQNTEPQFCPACGEKNPAMLSDCKYCGAKLDKYAYMGRIQQAEKKSVFETLGSTKKIVLFIVLVILVYALWFGGIALLPPIAIAAIGIGWKWTGSNISVFVDLTSDFFWGWLIGRVIISFFVGLFIGPVIIIKRIMNVN